MKPLDHKCSWCFAEAGKPCVDIQLGRWIDGFHHDRWFFTLQEVAKFQGKTIGELTIDMEPRVNFEWYDATHHPGDSDTHL